MDCIIYCNEIIEWLANELCFSGWIPVNVWPSVTSPRWIWLWLKGVWPIMSSHLKWTSALTSEYLLQLTCRCVTLNSCCYWLSLNILVVCSSTLCEIILRLMLKLCSLLNLCNPTRSLNVRSKPGAKKRVKMSLMNLLRSVLRACKCPVLVQRHTKMVSNLCRNTWTRTWLQQRRLILGGVPLVELAGKCESVETVVTESLNTFLSPWCFTPLLQIFTVWTTKWKKHLQNPS